MSNSEITKVVLTVDGLVLKKNDDGTFSQISSQTNWDYLNNMSDEQITAKAQQDLDNPEWTDEDFDQLTTQESSGNIFKDLGLPNPERELIKAQLTLQIYNIIKNRGLTQSEASQILGIKQPHVSALMRNRSGNFSVARLLEFLTALDQDVEISVRPKQKEHGELSIVVH